MKKTYIPAVPTIDFSTLSSAELVRVTAELNALSAKAKALCDEGKELLKAKGAGDHLGTENTCAKVRWVQPSPKFNTKRYLADHPEARNGYEDPSDGYFTVKF